MDISPAALELISKGSNSEIYKYGPKHSQLVLKIASHLKNEYHMLSKLNHQHIIRPLKYKQSISLNGQTTHNQNASSTDPSAENKNLSSRNVLVIEYATHGSLLNFLKKNKLEAPHARCLFKQIASTLSHLHCNYIVHRDLKLDNILVTTQNSRAHLKLADFGFACRYFQNGQILKFNSYKGTRRGYMAPQIHHLIEDPSSQYDATKADVFALGVILFALAFGKLPFQFAIKSNKIYSQIINKNYDKFWSFHQNELKKSQIEQHLMLDDLKQMLIGMLCYDPNERMSIKQVLQHSWMKGLECKFPLQKSTK